VLRVDHPIVEIAGSRFQSQSFNSDGAGSLALRLIENAEGRSLWPLDAQGGPTAVAIEADKIFARISNSEYSAEAALRVAFQVSIARQGGVLLHASSVRFGAHAVVAVGQSTAGKSTLAGLCREAGGQLLSDEMTALFPDGTVYGTPFRSSDPTPGHPGPANLGLFVLLDKAPHEALTPVAPEKALPRILEQVYRGYDGGELTPAKILERVAGAMNGCPPQLLSFRKDPEAGHFVRRYLERL
jgi:hypothetical protein